MIKRLTKCGNSKALVIDKAILDILKITDDTLLEISTDGKMLIIIPVTDANRKEKFTRALNHSDNKFGEAYKNLAD
ncbi:MAG: AbrB/MazE/SpoVT family DNA-binding domain-containing protein [Armatimonadota bacterium]